MLKSSAPCLEKGCYNSVIEGTGRCGKHQPEPWTGSNYKTPANWGKLRRQVLTRDAYKCRQCGQKGTDVDHIKPVASGGTHILANLQTLCQQCHQLKTISDAKKLKKEFNQAKRRGRK